MSSNFYSAPLFSRGPNNNSTSGINAPDQKMQSQDSIDQIMWAEAQSSALSKIKMLHTMAKSINDQQ